MGPRHILEPDVVRRRALEFDEAQLRLVPVEAVRRGRVTEVVPGVRFVPTRLGVVPHLETLILLVVDDRSGLQDHVALPVSVGYEYRVVPVFDGVMDRAPDVVRVRQHGIVSEDLGAIRSASSCTRLRH